MNLLKDYVIKLNLKAACNYEYLSGKPYGEIEGIEDMAMLAYSILISNNHIDFTYDIFLKLLGQKKVAEEISEALNSLIQVQSQFKPRKKEEKSEESAEGEKTQVWMSDLADYLIVQCGIDPHYVMYEMDLWQIEDIVQTCLDKKKGDLIEKRLFTFLEMSPLRLGKDTKGPEDILPFAWEKDIKKKELSEAESKAAFNFLNKPKNR